LDRKGLIFDVFFEAFVRKADKCSNLMLDMLNEQDDNVILKGKLFANICWTEEKTEEEWCTIKMETCGTAISKARTMRDGSVKLDVAYQASSHSALEDRVFVQYCERIKDFYVCNDHVPAPRQIMLCGAMLFDVLRDGDECGTVFERLRELHFFCGRRLDDYKDMCKRVDVWAKKGQKFVKGWYHLVSLINFSGYNTDSSFDDSRREEVRSWMLTDYNTMGDEPMLWRRAMGQAIVDACPVRYGRVKPVTLQQFVANTDNWMRAGAGSEAFELDDKSLGRTRAAFALNHSVEDICASVLDPAYVPKLSPSIKVELGQKKRIFASVDEVFNIGEAFISHWIEKALRQMPHPLKRSTLFMDGDGNWKFWQEVTNTVKLGRSYVYPFDAKSFDQFVGRNELEAAYDAIDHMLVEMGAPTEVRRVCYSNRQQMFRMQVGDMGTLRHGLPSGLRWTALFGTLINLGRTEVAKKLSQGLGVLGQTLTYGQGDDVLLISMALKMLGVYHVLMDSIGVGANEAKNFLMRGAFEYLRKHHSKNGPRGYLSRKIPGLLYRDPLASGGAHWSVRVKEKVRAIGVLEQRGGNIRRLLGHVLGWYRHAAKRHSHMSKSDYDNWLHTPIAYGGFGFTGKPSYFVELKQVVRYDEGFDDSGLNDCGGVQPQRLIDIARQKGIVGEWVRTAGVTATKMYVEQVCGRANKKSVDIVKTEQVYRFRKVLRGGDLRLHVKMGNIPLLGDSPDAQALIQWRGVDDIPVAIKQERAKALARAGEWDTLRAITAVHQHGVLERLRYHTQRRVLMMWISGELSIHCPTMLGVSALKLSRIRRFLMYAAWLRFIGLRNKCESAFVNISANGELDVKKQRLLHLLYDAGD
jgi:hypothetical protein